MAVGFIFEVSGVTADQYDAVMRDIGRESLDAPEPEGIIGHFAGRTSDGWRVIDVWESEEQAGRFYGSETFQKAVSANLPSIAPVTWPLHRAETYAPVGVGAG
jgi:hypothetical protein